MKTAVVTGATGFIGSYLVKELMEKDVLVYGIGTDIAKLTSKNYGEGFVPVPADFRVYNSLDKYINEKDIDVFFHLAWQGGFTKALKDYALQFSNAQAACDAVISASNMNCKKFVYAGTVNEIEINQFMNNERFIPRNTNIYASAKVAADMICRTLSYNVGMGYCSALIPLPYGVGNDSPQLINTVIKNCYTGNPSKLIKGDNQYDIAHISDIVRALYHIGEKGINMRSYYIGHRELKTFKEIVTDIRDVINPDAELRFGEYQDSLNMDYSYTDLDALYEDTGFECQADFEKTIREQSEWLKHINF